MRIAILKVLIEKLQKSIELIHIKRFLRIRPLYYKVQEKCS